MSARAAAPAPPPVPAAADFGLDAPKQVRQTFIRGGLLVLFGLAVWFMNRNTAPGPGAALCTVFAVIGIGYLAAGWVMRWSSLTGKIQVRERMLNAIPWRGDENVLDVGCGRGVFLIGAAKRIAKPGRATGADLSPQTDALNRNAQAEGVSDRVRVYTADARKLPYTSGLYDVVLSSLTLHEIDDPTERAAALRELWRVTKAGGHLGILDVAHMAEYLEALKRDGAEVIAKSGFSMLWVNPTTRWFVVRKP